MRHSLPPAREHFETAGRDRDLDAEVLALALLTLNQEIEDMSAQIDALKAAVASQDTLLGQIAAFLQGLPAAQAAAITAATAGDAAEAAAITADIQAHTASLAAALAAAGAQAPAGTTDPSAKG